MLGLTRALSSIRLSRFRHGVRIIALSVSALAAVACSKAPTKEELLARAKEAAAAQDYVQAEKDYRAVLRLSPGDPAAVRELAAIYHNQRQLAQSYPLLKKAAEVAPETMPRCRSISPRAVLRVGISSRRTKPPSKCWKSIRDTRGL